VKFLCLCQYGHSRSVACCRVLQARGHEAVAVGFGTARSAIPLLAEWADVIVLMEASYAKYVPVSALPKSVTFDVGPDRWSNPYNEELQGIIRTMADRKGY
jgi:hypothetical protein